MAYAANFVPEVWSAKTMKILDRECVMTSVVNRDHEGEVKKGGDTVHVRSFGEITIKNYTREMTLSPDTLSDPMSDLVIDQEKYFMFQVDDVDKAQADIKIMEGYIKRATDAIRRVVDQHLHSNYANVASGNITGSSVSPSTVTKSTIYADIVGMGQDLDEANASDDRHLIVDPKRKALLLQSTEFTRATSLGDDVVQNGMIGTVAGFKVHCSTNLNSANSNRPILALTPEFISFASQISKIEMVPNPYGFGVICKGLYVFGSKVFTNSELSASKAPDSQGAVLWANGT